MPSFPLGMCIEVVHQEELLVAIWLQVCRLHTEAWSLALHVGLPCNYWGFHVLPLKVER